MLKKFRVLIVLFLGIACVGYYLFIFTSTSILRVQNAFVIGNVTKIVSPTSGVIDYIGINKFSTIGDSQIIFSINKFEYDIKLQNALMKFRGAVREEIQQCINIQRLDKKIELADKDLEHSSNTLNKNRQLYLNKSISKLDYESFLNAYEKDSIERELMRVERLSQTYEQNIPFNQRTNIVLTYLNAKNLFIDMFRSNIVSSNKTYIHEIYVEENQRVEEGAVLATAVYSRVFKVQANILENHYDSIKVGQLVDIRFDALPSIKSKQGYVSSISAASAGSYSPLPRKDTDSTWVHVSQRVPIIITLINEGADTSSIPVGASADIRIRLNELASTKYLAKQGDLLRQTDSGPTAHHLPKFETQIKQALLSELSIIPSSMLNNECNERTVSHIKNWLNTDTSGQQLVEINGLREISNEYSIGK